MNLHFRHLTLFVVLLGSITVFSQKPKVLNYQRHDSKAIHFGFSVGVNGMDFQSQASDFNSDSIAYAGLQSVQPGINIHAIGNFRLGNYFDLRMLPGISFGERYIHYIGGEGENKYEGADFYKMESSYLELPVAIKYKAKRLNNFRPYLLGGGNLRYDLAVKKEYDINDQLFMVQPLQLYGEFGIGFDFYMVFFKLGIELKYSVGINNIMRQTNPAGESPDGNIAAYSEYFKKLYSNIFILSFHFE